MCLLIAKPAGIEIRRLATLCDEATQANSDGFGFAYVQVNGLVKHGRGLWKPVAQQRAIEKIGKRAAIFHWRFGTAGGTTVENCHPFVLPDKTVFAHNGIFPFQTPRGKSDTRVLADASETVDDLRAFTAKLIGPGNKIAYLHPGIKDPVILGEEHGIWRDGVWFSNLNHEWTRGYTPYRGSVVSTLDDAMARLVNAYGLDAVLDAAYLAEETLHH